MIQVVIFLLVVCSCVLTISLMNYLINKKIRQVFREEEEPTSLYLVKSVLFICVGLILSEVGSALREVCQIYAGNSNSKEIWFGILTYYSAFSSVAGLIIFVALWFAMMLFAVLSKGKNVFGRDTDLNYSILFSGILLGIFISIKSGLFILLMQLINDQTLPVFHG